MEKITSGDFAGIEARNRHHAFDLLVRAVEQSNLTEAELADRARVSPELVHDLLTRPRNVELNVLSRLVYAAIGAAIVFEPEYPR